MVLNQFDVRLQHRVTGGAVACRLRMRVVWMSQTQKNGPKPVFLISSCSSWSASETLSSLNLAHLRLQIVLQPDLADEVDLRFEKVDVLFGVVQDLLQQIA